MNPEKLTQAIQLIKAGNKPAAIPLLREVLQANPRDENAWLWLFACVEQAEQKKFCLQKALEINPGNQGAQQALNKLLAPPPLPSQPVIPAKTTLPQTGSQSVPSPKVSKSAPNRFPWILTAGTAALLIVACLTVVFLVTQGGGTSAIAASLPFLSTVTPTPTVTHTPTPTSTNTRTPSPTPTATATRRPTQTPIPGTSTPLPSPTIPPFTPGNPTATPWGDDITDQNFKKGWQAYQDEDFATVVDQMSLVIQAQPELAPAYRHRGMAFWYLGECSQALKDLEHAISIAPEYASAWAGLGVTYGCLGNDQQALQAYQKALSLDPSLAVVHHNLGAYYAEQMNFEKALEEYNLGLSIDPTRSSTWKNRSYTLALLGRFDECLALANEALANNPQAWYAYFGRGICKSSSGLHTEAIEDFETYLNQKPKDSSALTSLGYAYGYRADAYFEAGDYASAIPDYEKTISLINDVHFFCYLSEAYLLTQRYQKAIDTAETARSIDPECGKVRGYEIQARAYYGLGNYEKAVEYMNAAMAAGQYQLGYYYRGIMYQAAGEKEKAIQDLEYFIAFGYTGDQEKNATEDAKARLAKLKQ